ncbi:MAG: PEP-CTERM sorting domain-containing protein [Sedimenticola sp.]
MERRKFIRLIVATFILLASGLANATAILTQTPQGSYSNNVLTGSRWSDFTTMMQTQHTIDQVSNFENYSTVSSYSAVWVDQELGNTLTSAEISNLQNYFTSTNAQALVILDSNWNDNGYLNSEDNEIFAQNIVDWLSDTSVNKLVLIGENDSWNTWNQSIMDVVGGGFVSQCDWTVGTPSSSHFLTTGVSTMVNVCGSTIDPNLGNPDILFTNNLAAVYVADSEMPAPATLALMGLGLVGIGFARKKRAA